MAYDTANPPALIVQGISGQGRIWHYQSADAIATVNTSGYFSNGAALGMKVGDTVIVRDTNTPTTSLCTVIDVTAGGQADVSDGTAIAQTDSD
jgi:lipid-binding SYLF domain-containing protein